MLIQIVQCWQMFNLESLLLPFQFFVKILYIYFFLVKFPERFSWHTDFAKERSLPFNSKILKSVDSSVRSCYKVFLNISQTNMSNLPLQQSSNGAETKFIIPMSLRPPVSLWFVFYVLIWSAKSKKKVLKNKNLS